MADVEIKYHGSIIKSMSASGTETLHTEGFYCDDDIDVVYTSPGGGPVDVAFQVKDFLIPNGKWVLDRAVSNYIQTTGCLHIKFTIPVTLPSAGTELISLGADALSSWTPATNCSIFSNLSPSGMVLRLRGTSLDGTFNLTTFKDANNEVEIKIYKDRLVDVKTNTTYIFSQQTDSTNMDWSKLNTALTTLCNYSYISVGCNQYSARYSGYIYSFFAIESE